LGLRQHGDRGGHEFGAQVAAGVQEGGGDMLRLMTVIRKRPESSTEDFRRFMELEYGPTYVALPQVKEYVQS
jgi:hypothetical protein